MTDPVRVFLVGAGPGDPGLITRRGLELLRSCDVVAYDRLVSPALLDEVPESAERIFVGKEVGETLMPQATIDALIVDHARAGKRVVRLKGGDPFVFGRGADEAQALAAAGIPFEVVPGVTSAVAVPAYAGIPVTHSGVASSFTVLTAHESSERPGASERWRALAIGAQTLIFLMGVGALDDTVERLIDAGRDPDEPAAIIEWGTTPRQRTVVATLKTIAGAARDANIKPPATTIVGEVVRLRTAVDWFESRPLFGLRVVVTRPKVDSSSMTVALTEMGAEVIHFPVLEIVDPPEWHDLDDALKRLVDGSFEWAVFASAHAVDKTFERLLALGLDARAFGGTKVAAVGPTTASALQARGISPDLVPPRFTAAELASSIGSGSGSVFLPRPLEAPRGIVENLRAAGWDVVEVTAYETRPAPIPQDVSARITGGEFDVVTFLSPSAVDAFADVAGDAAHDKVVVCIGPATAEAATARGMRVSVVPEEHTAEGVMAALLETKPAG
jgi:uroporphyrinogen III methyltransferase/synthase